MRAAGRSEAAEYLARRLSPMDTLEQADVTKPRQTVVAEASAPPSEAFELSPNQPATHPPSTRPRSHRYHGDKRDFDDGYVPSLHPAPVRDGTDDEDDDSTGSQAGSYYPRNTPPSRRRVGAVATQREENRTGYRRAYDDYEAPAPRFDATADKRAIAAARGAAASRHRRRTASSYGMERRSDSARLADDSDVAGYYGDAGAHASTQAPAGRQAPTNYDMPAPHTQSSHANAAAQSLVLADVGGFKDLRTSLDALPAETVVSGESAQARLLALKQRLNELQKLRRKYWTRLGQTAVAGGAGALVTLSGAAFASSANALHIRNRLGRIKTTMRSVIDQINQLRKTFGGEPGWTAAERQLSIDERVFQNDIKRGELVGDL